MLNLQNKIENDNSYPTEKFKYINCIGGGVIFGHKTVLNKWIEEYYNMLELFIKNEIEVNSNNEKLFLQNQIKERSIEIKNLQTQIGI